MRRVPPHFDRHTRFGYTLIEMLIASGLVAVLMSTAWGMMSLYTGLLTAGRAGAAEQQLARSLFRLISDDARRAVMPEVAGKVEDNVAGQLSSAAGASIQNRPSDGFDSSMSSLGRQESLNPGTDFVELADVEFVGNDRMLRITGLRASDLETAFNADSDGLSADSLQRTIDDPTIGENNEGHLTTVIYQFEQPGIRSSDERELPAGLHRLETDAQTFLALQQSSSEASNPYGDGGVNAALLNMSVDPFAEEREPIEREHAPEVVRCRFRYFDGRSWTTQWDSRLTRSLPNALHVQLWLVSAAELDVIQQSLNPAADSFAEIDSVQSSTSDEYDPLGTIGPRLYEWLTPLTSVRLPSSRSRSEPTDFDTLQTGAALR